MQAGGPDQLRMSNGEYYLAGESESENVANLQAANNPQIASEYFTPPSSLGESSIPYGESETFAEAERQQELEFFLNEVRDNDFETMMYEMLQELESNFEQNYGPQHGLAGGELESMTSQQDFENVLNTYSEASMAQLVPKIHSELDSFSNYIQNNVQTGAEYDTFERVVDSYQPVQAESFIKRLVKRVAKGVKGFVKRGLKVVGRVAGAAINVAKLAISGPLKAAVSRFIGWIRNSISQVLKSLIRRVIARLPPVTRPFITRAARAIGLAEQESMASSEADVRSAELLAELDVRTQGDYEQETSTEGPSTEIEAEAESESENMMNTELELEQELQIAHDAQNQVAELLREFDTEAFNYGESELSHLNQAEFYSPSMPSVGQYSQPNMMMESGVQEASSPPYAVTEAYNSEASQMPQEAYAPEAFLPEAAMTYQPSQAFVSPESAAEVQESFLPEAAMTYQPSQAFVSPESAAEVQESFLPEAAMTYQPSQMLQPSYYYSSADAPMENKEQQMAAAYDRFVNAMASNPSSFHQEFESFAPAILGGVRLAFRVVPPLRNTVVNMIAQLLERLLGRWIPKHIGDMAYRPLASLLLRAMGLEAPQQDSPLQNKVYAEAMANTAAQALLNASALPESLLEGDQQVLQSELESIVQQAVLDNIPSEALAESFTPRQITRRGPIPIHFISRNGYQRLNRLVRVRLLPSQIRQIRLRSPFSLADFLKNNYNWNERSPVTLDIAVFRTIPAKGRISRMLRDYFGRNVRLTAAHFRQLHRMSKRTARRLRILRLWSASMPAFFIIRRAMVATTGAVGALSGTVTSGRSSVSGTTMTSPPATTSQRPSDIRVTLDTLGQLKASIYVSNQDIARLGSVAGNAALQGIRATMNRILPSGELWITNLLTRLKMPRSIARPTARLLLRLVRRYINRASSNLIRRVIELGRSSRGVTVSLTIRFPRDIIARLLKISPLQLPSLIRSIASSSFSFAVSAGYNI
jgi:hypothetical protein